LGCAPPSSPGHGEEGSGEQTRTQRARDPRTLHPRQHRAKLDGRTPTRVAAALAAPGP
jgi:hypothetical protein